MVGGDGETDCKVLAMGERKKKLEEIEGEL